MTNTRTITLPEELCQAVEKRFAHRAASVEEFIKMALAQFLREDALVMDAAEQQIIEERLKGLGYI